MNNATSLPKVLGLVPGFRFLILAGLSLVLAVLAGCASGPRSDPRDPWEPMNRKVWQFNEAVDDAVLKPVASAYKEVVPTIVRKGVNNFFANLGDAWSFVNNVLQLKPLGAVESLTRFNVNTFLGVGGLFDIATEMNIDRHKEDFGQTLGRWGIRSGPYLVLPLLGPSTLRDTAAFTLNSVGDPVASFSNVSVRNSAYVLRIVDTRARFLGASSMLEGAALDRYSFTRDVFLQIRRRDVEGENGEDNPPNEPADDPSKDVPSKEAAKP
jgi:phospholipid-binding lipoprotein MlaA